MGCLKKLAILGYGFWGLVFIIYMVSPSNDVIGYYDLLFLIVFILLPIGYLLDLTRFSKLKSFFNSLMKIILNIFLLSYIGYIIVNLESNSISYNSLHISFFALLFSVYLYFIYIKPYLEKSKSKRQLILGEKKKIELKRKLTIEGKEQVEISNKDFKNKLKNVHGEKFDYSKAILEHFHDVDVDEDKILISYSKSIELTCLKHEMIFQVSLDDAFKTVGCNRCKIEEEHFNSTKKVQEINTTEEKLNDIIKLAEENKEISKKGFAKTDLIFNNLFSALNVIKSSVTNSENSISKGIQLIIDKSEIEIDKNELDLYETKVKAWLNFWNILEDDTKGFMPRAEFLYEKIKKSAFNDYSPFILYYCRALEFELFHKIFLEYHNYIERKFKDKTILFEYNKTSLSSKAIKEIESGIIQGFKRGVLNNSPKYTLGDMRLLLNLLPSENKTKGSNRFQTLLALQELSLFINNKIGRIPSDLIIKIEGIITDYRNPSAHIGIIDESKAELFYKDYKELMNDLMGLFNNKI